MHRDTPLRPLSFPSEPGPSFRFQARLDTCDCNFVRNTVGALQRAVRCSARLYPRSMRFAFMKSRALRFALIIVAASLMLMSLWIWLTLNWSYSEGERAGYVQKLSSKGWLCKTWEGEIAMVTMPGAIPEKFPFTVRDAAVAGKINDLAGKRVVLSYQQHKFIPSSCFG